MTMTWLLISMACIGISGVPGLVLGRRGQIGQWLAAVLNAAGAVGGALGLVTHFASTGGASDLRWTWSMPIGNFHIGLDDLSALFLIPMLLISALGSIYGLEYWRQPEHPGNGRKLRLSWGLMTAGMMLVLLARDSVVLLMAWEIMALAAFFLVTTEDRKAAVQWAGWVYLVATHVGTLCLLAAFALLRQASGSFELWSTLGSDVPSSLTNAIFITGMAGFGLKAGLIPLHVWLPGAHASAPSHVSAILSGVLLKVGVYGMIRIASLMSTPPLWWGATLLIVGAVTGIVAIAFALAQHDFKRLLAYSSIENIGIITIGIGLALLGRSLDRADWIVLGLGGALLHVLNHSLFKPLLFFGAGGILHATRTRQIDLLGGLGKSMPRTFVLTAIGAAAICGLPPLNGFVSELLIYVGLFRSVGGGQGSTWVWAGLAAPVLAVMGALAVATFVKLIGTVFSGAPRTRAAERAHESGLLMLAPVAILALCCAAIGLAPALAMPLVNRAATVFDPSAADKPVGAFVPLGTYSIVASGLLLLVVAGVAFIRLKRFPISRTVTWDCGYVRPTPRMQYTGSSFAQLLTGLLRRILLTRRSAVALRGLFPSTTRFSTETPDPALDRGLVPALSAGQRILSRVRPIQRQAVQVYLLYMLGILLVLLLVAWW